MLCARLRVQQHSSAQGNLFVDLFTQLVFVSWKAQWSSGTYKVLIDCMNHALQGGIIHGDATAQSEKGHEKKYVSHETIDGIRI